MSINTDTDTGLHHYTYWKFSYTGTKNLLKLMPPLSFCRRLPVTVKDCQDMFVAHKTVTAFPPIALCLNCQSAFCLWFGELYFVQVSKNCLWFGELCFAQVSKNCCDLVSYVLHRCQRIVCDLVSYVLHRCQRILSAGFIMKGTLRGSQDVKIKEPTFSSRTS